MIAVIADDLSGAAELAGIGLRNNLQVEMNTDVSENTKAELLVIATDTRSMNEPDAIAEVKKITSQVTKLKPQMIYKKVDSVLRGHVLAELVSQLKVLEMERALLIPANPSLGRTISNGIYFYNGRPVQFSSFANDPEFAITSSDVLKMLRVRDDAVYLKTKEEALPGNGIIVGEVRSSADLLVWAKCIEVNTLAAGGAEFFSAILDTLDIKKSSAKTKAKEFGHPVLFVCGSTFNNSREAIKTIKKKGGPVSYMPVDVVRTDDTDKNMFEKWRREVLSLLKANGKAIISINSETTEGTNVSAGMLRNKTAKIVNEVLKEIKVGELLVEGGSTAAAVIRKSGFTCFFPTEELAPGVVRMIVNNYPDLCITVKPGSYAWPEKIWKFD